MLRRINRAALSLVATAALTLPAVATASGPESTERAPSPRWAEITRTDAGYRYLASLHDSSLTLTRVGDRVVLHDRAMRRFRQALPAGCRRVTVARGIAASCRVPGTATAANPLELAIVPQAGNDRVDGSALSAVFKLILLAAAGDDVATGGAGADELNGALGIDRLTGGAGDDLIRVGPGNDIGDGGAGEDELVGTDGADHLSGGEGEDVLRGDAGKDTLLGGPAADSLICGPGFDTTDDDEDTDGVSHCEAVLP
ncbi:calcium-binding protein [Nocardioides sp. HM23]|uniref:calcium-binding protein n=1 Tax=Nocardioides bizhenqiangii TaxID=3095076 RepID=UPI002ACA0362|nr:calcium-binding protein [Nocardioides sp. HM23]MDZ5622925.1 calcium-binding protein [Nocardioides sp. HM23]